MNPEQWLSLKWNGGSTMSDRWLNQSKIIHIFEILLLPYEFSIYNQSLTIPILITPFTSVYFTALLIKLDRIIFKAVFPI